ncbi:hypothetical protein F5883DRAFT_135315 [Diaporthe sp. PMI_573]|nr:hypothetical protein F5883DRAFT_135315 [Diaporthaceae sp. PMI_573]
MPHALLRVLGHICPALSRVWGPGPVIHTSKRCWFRGGSWADNRPNGRAAAQDLGSICAGVQFRSGAVFLAPQGCISSFRSGPELIPGASCLYILFRSLVFPTSEFRGTMFMIRAAPAPVLKYVAISLMVFSYVLLLLPVLAL